MGESYLDAFSEDYPDSPATYYQTKVKAALVLDDERAPGLLEAFRESPERLTETSTYWERIPEYHQALVDGSPSTAEGTLSDLYEYYVDRDPDPDDPRWYVLHALCALIVLGRRRGIDATIESDRLPEAFLRDEVPADDVELDVDLSDLQVTSDVGVFELERDEDGSPVIPGRIYTRAAER